jgi:hypothetical protein
MLYRLKYTPKDIYYNIFIVKDEAIIMIK